MPSKTLLATCAFLPMLVRRWRHRDRPQRCHAAASLALTSAVPDPAESASGSLSSPPDAMPLMAIRDRERELAQLLHEARRAAAALLAQAQERAKVMTATAESAGQSAATAYYQREMAQVEQVAAQIRATGQAAACRLRQAGQARLEQAVQRIIAFVLPT